MSSNSGFTLSRQKEKKLLPKMIKTLLEKVKIHKKKIFIALLAILVAFVARSILFPKKPQVSTTRAKSEDLILTVSASGKTESQNQVDLKFQTSGKLAWVGVKEGDEVKKWQAVASLDKEELKKRIEKAMNDYLEERWDFEQSHADYGTSGKSKEEWLVSDAAKRILEKAQFDLNNVIIDVELADITAKLATIVSPIEGIVTHIDTPVAGVNITPATAVFTVADPNSVIFVANVDEADIGQVSLGQKVKITLDAYLDQEFEGQVKKISFASITTTGGGTAFPVEISLPENQDLKFKVGMNGDVEIITQEKSGVLTVPSDAIWRRDDKNFVWKVVSGKAKKQEVKTGLEVEDKTEILEGLSEGEEVVSKDVSKIKADQIVK
ncbi:hypothetical protein COU95_01010 [Candidatus Shapirobacteria bacterium CG10_big_fil_rev_8_21_14_0_10_40_9]|uniref:RND efflux pump membrane fusion protein barrel-sandwich domain-containing protein n=1 Tax=Candidatus Shapirobacteria bacterium CG10_big_fil_rev_8_21_14_0_10_40_9 TaxID=1974888 RepID=A0A2M8L497_9BACT|nr:MAG: hypothetical protein COU95_01010 [Candidatus Shapirobacteria bacterium CG10_big_fil_rev_8_21_14_0_10_40_9]